MSAVLIKRGEKTSEVHRNKKKLMVESHLVLEANPSVFDCCEDMALMTSLNEATVLHNLRMRFRQNLIHVSLSYIKSFSFIALSFFTLKNVRISSCSEELILNKVWLRESLFIVTNDFRRTLVFSALQSTRGDGCPSIRPKSSSSTVDNR